MDRKDYIREYRKNNPEKVRQWNHDYYLRNKEGLVIGKPERGDRVCPKCNQKFNTLREVGTFVILAHAAVGRKEVLCAYTMSYNKKEFYG